MFKSASALFTMFFTAAVLLTTTSTAHAFINVTEVQDVPNLLDTKVDESDCDSDQKTQTASDEEEDSKTRRQRRRAKETSAKSV